MTDATTQRTGHAPSETWQAFAARWAETDDYSTLVALARQVARRLDDRDFSRGLVPVRLAIVSDATIDLIRPVLEGALVARGVRPTLHVAPYGQVTTSLLDAGGPLDRFGPQVVIVATTPAQVAGWPDLHESLERIEARVERAVNAILEPCERVHARTGADIIVNTLHAPVSRALGNLGAKTPGDPVTFLRRVNLALADRAPAFVHVNDVAYQAERRGLDRWFDEQYWYDAKQPVAFDAIGDYCRHVAAMVGALLGRSKKCLVVDLDNTLWGGVVGDDGLGGIAVGPGQPLGEAYSAFQAYVKDLKNRGVLLAVSSKNDDQVARAVFTDHPDMTLRLDDFVAFKANWGPKSASLRAMAGELDLPLDAFVFVDDNPAERAEVAMAVPEVTVVSLPEDPAGYVRALERTCLFEMVRLTAEDTSRTIAYQARRQSLDAREASTDVGAYLASLDMRARVHAFDDVSIERITQLVNKTNQFNLTTPRVVAADMRRLMTNPGVVTRMVRLSDRYAVHGLISVAWAHVDGVELVIDAWLMSCRVLGRGVEHVVFNDLLRAARTAGLTRLAGTYAPSGRNGLVKDLYRSLGFARLDREGPVEYWSLDVAAAETVETAIALDELTP
jgi:FkbH-like protein